MIKKTITYTDLDNNKVSEDLYFNINKAEALTIEIESEESMSSMLKRISDEPDARKVLGLFKTFIEKGYGIRSEDRRTFLKSEKLFSEFKNSEAYSELLWKMINEPLFAADLFIGMLPQDVFQEQLDNNPKAKREYMNARKQLEEANKREEKAFEDRKKAAQVETDGFDIYESSSEIVETDAPVEPEEDLSTLSREELLARLAQK